MLEKKKSVSSGGSTCPPSEEIEVLVKQIYAALFKSWGYDVGMSDSDIDNEKKFVGSAGGVFNGGCLNPANLKNLEVDKDVAIPTVSASTKETFARVEDAAVFQKYVNEKKEGLPKTKAKAHPLVGKYDVDGTHSAFFTLSRNDLFDTSVAKFVRARKFKNPAALEMFAKCLDWRFGLHQVDKSYFSGDAEIYKKKTNPEMIDAFKLNQAYLRGKDNEGRPIIVIHVKKHFRGNCPDRDFEQFICMNFEWAKLCLKEFQEGVDKGSVLFDMEGFSLKNADLAAVQFLAKNFEAYYPEQLGAIWIHKAPWIFNTVWKIIKGWLDPVVASKIHFTNSTQDLEKFVSRKYIPKLLGGDDTYKMDYVIPTAENSDPLPIDEKAEALIKDRKELLQLFVETTLKWIKAKTPSESASLLKHRVNLQISLAKNYISLDPYVRHKGVYDRNGEIGAVGY